MGEEAVLSCRTEEEEEEEVMVVGERQIEEEEKSGVVRWERFLPRMSVRVLLVEADDSTRQIIAALLRKCSYRVSAVADGLKAWESLKEKPQDIDLVLTEVELPSVSGFNLLTMIAEHETCKNIPVIMMSSHDSVNMVFKCMLKGAADFLVKPIRKNELRNLWQHVWRRHLCNGGPGGTYGHQYENLGQRQQMFDADSEDNAASNHSSEYVACVQKNRDCSEKGSDTQSSCTRPDTEAESAYMQNMQEHNQPNCRNSPLSNHMGVHEGEACNKLEDDLLMHGIEAEGKKCADAGVTAAEIVMSTSCVENTNITYETDEQIFDQANQSREVDLIGAIDNQTECSYGLKKCIAVRGNISSDAEIPVDVKDHNCKPVLELSLRRYQPSGSSNQENDECNTLNHSNSSAFSRYNSRTVLPPISTPNNSRIECEDFFSNYQTTLLNPGLFSSNTSQCKGLTLKNQEDAKSPAVSLLNKDGTTIQCSHLGVLPFPVTISSMTHDNLHPAYGSVMQPIYYPQPVPPMWNTNSPTQEANHVNLSSRSNPDPLYGDLHDQNAKNEKEQDQNMESLEEQRFVSSVTGQSGDVSVCNGSRSHLNSSGYGSVCNGSNGNLTATDVARTTAQSGNYDLLFIPDGIKLTDVHRSIQREAALNKFRLKRKERCFEKKVRYQSRKRLAEQRPRVKGQFVRQVQPDHQSLGADSYHCDSMAA